MDWLVREREMLYSDLNLVSIPLVLFMVLSFGLSRLVRFTSIMIQITHQYCIQSKSAALVIWTQKPSDDMNCIAKHFTHWNRSLQMGFSSNMYSSNVWDEWNKCER